MMTQNNLVVAGIDVAKDKVDVCIRTVTERKTYLTTAPGRRSLIAWLGKHQVGKAVMEASGGYERVWAKALRQAGLEVRIVDPKRVRSFAESAGRLVKNDKIDAEMIAWFAETFSEAPSQVDDPAHDEIKALVKGRKSLIDLRSRLEMQKGHEAPLLVRKARARLLNKLAGEITTIETEIVAKIKATPAFAVRAEIIQSVPGFAEGTALTLLAGLPELGQVSNEAAAALVGVAPYDDETAASLTANAASKAAAAGCEMPCTCLVSARRH